MFAFCRCKQLDRVIFSAESKLEEIGEGSFQESSLAEIVIPKSVVTIGEKAFAECDMLEKVTIQEGSALEKIESRCF